MYMQIDSYLLILLNELEMCWHSHNRSTGCLCAGLYSSKMQENIDSGRKQYHTTLGNRFSLLSK